MSNIIRIQVLKISVWWPPISLPFFPPSCEERLFPPTPQPPLGYDDDVDDYCAASQEKPRWGQQPLRARSPASTLLRVRPRTSDSRVLPQNASSTAGVSLWLGWSGRICVDSPCSPQRRFSPSFISPLKALLIVTLQAHRKLDPELLNP